jgi:cell division protein FtsI/penicillin-binding protein 2
MASLIWLFASLPRSHSEAVSPAESDKNRSAPVTPPIDGTSPCATALAQRAVCTAANQRALEIMNAGQFEAFTLMQDVRTGSLIAFAASQPAKLDVTTPVLPLSVIKLLLAASWWDNGQRDAGFDSYRGPTDTRKHSERLVSIHEMLVNGSDNAGRQMAVRLRRVVGTERIIDDFERYGFVSTAGLPGNDPYWGDLAPAFSARLSPVRSFISLHGKMTEAHWADALSLGEKNLLVTGLHISRFLQAIGNNGTMLRPSARELKSSRDAAEVAPVSPKAKSSRAMTSYTVCRLQAGMREAVRRGTAKSIATSLADTGWEIGGKTGTGPGPAPIGPQSDGWFAGLVFDPKGKARFTVATFVRHGGPGGGNAAKISAELARFVIGR